MSDDRILEKLGQLIQQERLSRNWTQVELAKRSGIGLRTLSKAESGGVTTLETFVAILRALEILNRLELLLPERSISPVQLAKWQGKQRKKASKPRGPQTKSEAGLEDADGRDPSEDQWKWAE